MILVFFIMLVVLGAMVFGGVMLALSILFRVAFGLLLLPFRLIGALIWLPIAILFALFTPLLPVIAIVGVIWLLLKASVRPTVI
jgi:hypothetical protein